MIHPIIVIYGLYVAAALSVAQYSGASVPSNPLETRSPAVTVDHAKQTKPTSEPVIRNPLQDNLINLCFNETNGQDFSHFNGLSNLKENSRQLIRGSHGFALSLTRRLAALENKDHSNGIVISPFSIWSTLIVMYMGAKGETASEIANALAVDSIPRESIAMAHKGLRHWYKVKGNINRSPNASDESKHATFSVANRVFFNSNIHLNKCIEDHFLEEVQPIDFTDSKNAVESINWWINETTHGKIQNLLSPDAVNAFTQLIVSNAVYFKSPWQSKFDTQFSFNSTFYVSPSENISVLFMKQTSNFLFAFSEDLSASIIDIPYVDSNYSMLLMLPESSRGVDNLLATLTPDDIYQLVSQMYFDQVELVLPKFKCEQEVDLAGVLYSLGIRSLFDPSGADLTGFIDQSFDTPSIAPISVNSALHKAMISIDEDGSQGAAATVFFTFRSARPLFPTKFTVDRPFIYFIRDTVTNVILFSGLVRRPVF